MHKNPYKHRFIAGSARCSTKPLSILLTKLLTHIKQGLQKYCETAFSRSGVNQMWILKNSKELLEHLKSPNFNNITSIKSIDFSTLYTTIPHDKLKSRLASVIRNSFMFKKGNSRYKYVVLGHEESYFVKEHSDSKHKDSEDDNIRMLEFLVDNIFGIFAGKVFQQIVGIPMGTNCAPLLADLFLYSYEAEFIQSLLSTGRNQLASRFNFTYRYIDDVLSIDLTRVLYLIQHPNVLFVSERTNHNNTSRKFLDMKWMVVKNNTSIGSVVCIDGKTYDVKMAFWSLMIRTALKSIENNGSQIVCTKLSHDILGPRYGSKADHADASVHKWKSLNFINTIYSPTLTLFAPSNAQSWL